ncbi:type 1 glutamine amidotransferase domain-containing protein [Janthinobacterium lividum]|uniref:type 1 glutamine amidotransferase domain-containing protein n=1 Tax=Janthinobacterium lividum TaxID=29581 RepID=UPI00087488D5|nr:type 1 glutamine amidotransferase domain-containing protein [Janthinobacterium lividum]MCC7713412.1 type 1 glutamine amidotransferase domain-containing protein [Janthinobacterium lividum]OEZ55096.1 molecular chaperone Hsp31 and glyoxalase 3 [Janthinobacterium lividum]WQE26477.1 type 1 glutamine amidotransferase domain-containing protein [Janthinobacterium lividum]STQ97366.1 chaperone protein HchA [Janthinobacterium lividum]
MSVFKQLFLAFMPLLFAQMVAAEPASPKREPGTVLVVMTNHSQYPSRSDHTGLWLTELTHVYDALKDAGFGVDFVSPNGGAVPLDERSLGWLYMDAAAKNHLKDPAFMAALESTHAPADIDPAAYQAIFYTGGHGTMWDFKGNQELKRIAEAIYRNGGIVSSVCHGAAGLLDLQDDNGKPLIQGRRVTGFSNTEESLAGIKEQVPYLLQSELEGRGALYDKSFIPFGSFVMTDGRLVTGQNPGSSKEVAQALLTALRNNKPY